MFPRHDDNLRLYVIGHENGIYRSDILVLSVNGEMQQQLLASSWCATAELALEDLTFIQHRRHHTFRGMTPWIRQEWLQSLAGDWQETQMMMNNNENSSASGGT